MANPIESVSEAQEKTAWLIDITPRPTAQAMGDVLNADPAIDEPSSEDVLRALRQLRRLELSRAK